MGKKFSFLLLGGVVGAVAGVLCAPKKGEETRAELAGRLNEAWGQAQNFSGEAGAKVQEVAGNATSKVQEVAGNATAKAKEAASNIKPLANSNDELRQKIEAARARIAAQVEKNSNAAPEQAEAPSAETPVANDAAGENPVQSAANNVAD